jgi:choline dehydrogenase-like flavoprotein
LPGIKAKDSRTSLSKRFDKLSQNTYDYIVVGGGTAGNVIANRLTEDPDVTVLVIEAGGPNTNIDSAHVPPLLGLSLAPGTKYDWNSTTAGMPGLNGRSIAYPRGKVLGGSSIVNHYLYTPGSKDDYNHYAKLTGDDSWNWKNMQKYIKKTEKFVAPADGHDTSSQYEAGEPSTSGILPVSLPGYSTPLDQRFLDTTKQFSSEFPFNQDINSGNPLGMGENYSSGNERSLINFFGRLGAINHRRRRKT